MRRIFETDLRCCIKLRKRTRCKDNPIKLFRNRDATVDHPSASRAIFGQVSHGHDPEFDVFKDQQEEEERMNEEDDEDEELSRQEKEDDEEDEDIYSDDMRAV